MLLPMSDPKSDPEHAVVRYKHRMIKMMIASLVLLLCISPPDRDIFWSPFRLSLQLIITLLFINNPIRIRIWKNINTQIAWIEKRMQILLFSLVKLRFVTRTISWSTHKTNYCTTRNNKQNINSQVGWVEKRK